jgi:hypothetical protein
VVVYRDGIFKGGIKKCQSQCDFLRGGNYRVGILRRGIQRRGIRTGCAHRVGIPRGGKRWHSHWPYFMVIPELVFS